MPPLIDFIGRYDHTLDAKNRLMIPQTYRDIVQKAEKNLKFHITRGLDGCLAMYADSTWNVMVALLKSRKAEELADAKKRKFFRVFYGNAVEVVPDKAGRVVIPEHLREMVKLKKKVILSGANDRIEIWDPEVYAQVNACGEGEFEKSAEEAFGNSKA